MAVPLQRPATGLQVDPSLGTAARPSPRTYPSDQLADKRSSARILAALSGTVAVIALLGWIFDIEELTSWLPGQSTMKFNNALSILLLSAVWFVPRRIAPLLITVAAGIAAAALVEYLGVGIDLNSLVVRDAGISADVGRMSVVTGCCILLLAWSLGMLATGHRLLVEAAAAVALALVGLALLAFLFDVPSIFADGPFSTLAQLTAGTLGMLSVATLLSVPAGSLSWMLHGRDVGARILRVLLACTVVALPLFGYLRLLGQRAGWYATNFGTAVLVAAAILALTFTTWVVARALARIDARRAAALADLEVLTSQLDQRVRERTAELEQERRLLLLAEAAAREAYADSERANAAKDRFLSRVSHELRTPLNAVLGFGQLLELEELTAGQEQSVSHILCGGRHLLSLIDDLLDISGTMSDTLELEREAVPVSALVTETIALMGPMALAGGIEMQFDPGQGDECLWADRQRLQQVLVILLSNGIKYNGVGGRVIIGVRPGEDGFSSISVSDTGSGIAAADLPRLFEPFDRLGRESQEIEGTGIGLTLARRLVIGMGGLICAESTAGLGSTFTVAMPTAGRDDALPTVSSSRREAASSGR